MKYIALIFLVLIFSGCAILEPDFGVTQEKSFEKKRINESNITVVDIKEKKSLKDEDLNNSIENEHIILNVFDDELYFEKDKVTKNKRKIVIKYLDAYSWEKRALRKIYAKYKRIWSKKQSADFQKILKENKYFSLCADRRYWDNLEFEESEPERDILHSILLIKYLNNLSHGCSDWVESNGMIKDENKNNHINAQHILSLLPHNVLIKKLLLTYSPKERKFFSLLKRHRAFIESDKAKDEIKIERLKIEKYKKLENHPSYKK